MISDHIGSLKCEIICEELHLEEKNCTCYGSQMRFCQKDFVN